MPILFHYIQTGCLSLYGALLFRMTTGYFLWEIIHIKKHPKYTWKWNLAKSLVVDYASTANSWVEEPFGELNTQEKRDSLWDSFWSLGQLNDFNQKVNVNYTLPLRKIKILDWTKLTTKYSASYEWRNAPPASKSLGNTIQNSRSIAVNGNLNFVSLYNKVPFLKKINRPSVKLLTSIAPPFKKNRPFKTLIISLKNILTKQITAMRSTKSLMTSKNMKKNTLKI